MFGFDQRWLVVGCGVLALAVGLLVPRPSAFATRGAHADATVPPELARTDAPLPPPDVSPTVSRLTVDVCGAVRNPGVLELAPGTRAIDAVKAAGGPLPEADLDRVNLAQPLVDAMKLCVPRKGQSAAFDSSQVDDAAAPYRSTRHHGRGAYGRTSNKLLPGQTLDVNTATADELTRLPGVGPGLAQRIVEFRLQNGPFQSTDDLQNVPGLGASKFERLAPFVRL